MLKTSVSPHIHSNQSIQRSMWNVNIALVPALLASVYFFGFRSLWLVVISVLTAVLSEYLLEKIFHKTITIQDGSAVITGILVAFNMPPQIPFYIPVVATLFAIVIVKHFFGGLGNNIFNPALAGRVFVMFAWTIEMTTWSAPIDPQWLNNLSFQTIAGTADAVTSATPLAVNKMYGIQQLITQFGTKIELYKQLFFGRMGGCLGETSALAILAGAVYLFVRRIMAPVIPILFIGTVMAVTAMAGQDPVFHILSGGLILGAFFMATDYVTSPFTLSGMIIYAVGCGLLTSFLRLKSGMPEGVSFSILLMNALTPLIDRYTGIKVYGKGKK